MKPRGKLVALSTAAVGVVVLAVAGTVAKDRIREEWYLWRLRHSEEHSQSLTAKRREDETRSDAPIDPDIPIVEYSRSRSTIRTPDPPTIDTSVKAVDAKEQLVLLSAGKDQKVELGYESSLLG